MVQTASMEHNITDNANQAMAYRAMPDAIVRDSNPYLYKDPDYPYSLPVSALPYGGIYYRQDSKALSYQYRLSANYSTAGWEHFVTTVPTVWEKPAPQDGCRHGIPELHGTFTKNRFLSIGDPNFRISSFLLLTV